MTAEDYFSSSLAPICFAILSDKSRERTLALAKLHSILPGTVRQKDFTSDSAEKVLKSFLDWLQAEIRISRKSGSNNSTSVSAALKELKWIICLFDENFPRINLSGIVFELIDRLSDALNFGNFPEIIFILNQQILSKSPYLKLLQSSKLTSRFNRLLMALYERSEQQESSIKSLTFLAISLPNSLKLEPFTYEMFHESFLKFLSSGDNCGFLPSLLGAINYLFLDYFEHSQKYRLRYFPFVLNWLRLKNNPVLFLKCLQFFLLVLDQLTEPDRLLLSKQLEKELDDPQNCPLFQIDPVTFCFEIIEAQPATASLTRQMFLTLCYKLDLKFHNIPMSLFSILKYKESPSGSTSHCNGAARDRVSSDWSVLIHFHTRQSSINFNTLAKSSLNWYKLWFISRNPLEFPSIKMDDLDEFVHRTLKSSTLPLNPLGFEGFAAYFRLRFKNLWWTQTACDTFNGFIEAIYDQDYTLSPALLKCLLPHCEIGKGIDQHIEDQKALDCSLFLNRLDQLERCTEALFGKIDSSDQQHKDSTPRTIPLVMPEPFLSLLRNCKSGPSPSSGRASPPTPEILSIFSFIASLYDQVQPDSLIGFICRNSGSLWLFELFAPLIAKKLPITNLLSFLIPNVRDEQANLFRSEADFEDDDFKTKSSEFEVNPSCPQLFNFNKQGSPAGFFTRLSLVLMNCYEATNEEEKQILNDWKVFMTEFCGSMSESDARSECDLTLTIITTSQELAVVLRECRPFFNLPPIKVAAIDPKLVLPSLLTISKKILTPEQWIPFIWILLNSKAPVTELIIDWLRAVPVEFFSNSRHLHKLIKLGSSSLLANEFLKKWIETSKSSSARSIGSSKLIGTSKLIGSSESSSVESFPFHLFTLKSPVDFIGNSPYVSLLLHDKPAALKDLDRNSPFLQAAALLEESAARHQSRKPADFSNIIQGGDSVQQFLPLSTALLSHGQYHSWPVLVSALQSLAKKFKLSAATDFSELFNPIHSLFILRGLSGCFVSAKFLKTLFSNVPILGQYPQLLHFALRLITAGGDRRPCELAELEREFPTELKAIKDESIPVDGGPSGSGDHVDFVSFVLKYGHAKLFSKNNSKLIELLFDLLNLTNLSGSRVFPLESFEDAKVREDLKMLILAPGSKVLCFDRQSPPPESAKLFAESESYWKSVTEAGLLCDLCKFLCSYNDEKWSPLLSGFFGGSTDEHTVDFLQLVLPFLLDSINKKASYTVIPELVQRLVTGLSSSSSSGSDSSSVAALILSILHLIIEKTPVGPNLVDTILRRFSFNPKIFKTLQNRSSQSSRLFYFSLLRESPKLANSELNLEELEEILQNDPQTSEENEEYLMVVKKRLSKFDDFDIEWPESSKGSAATDYAIKEEAACWLDRKWFDKGDFCGNRLLLKDFIIASSNLGKLHSILIADYSVEIDRDRDNRDNDEAEIFKMLRNCCISRKKLTGLNFKEILKVASEVKKLNFKGIGLLPLCSPKLEQVSRHLLADMSAQIHWKRGEFEEALEISKESLKLFPSTVLPDESKALLLSRIGEWASASKSERPSHILSQYFEKAMALCENTSNCSAAALAQIHIKVARFLDEQYQQIKESEDFKNRAKLLEESRAALTAARNASSAASQQDRINISVTTLRNQYELDMQEYSERKRSLNSFLTKAVDNYISAVSFGVTGENDQMAAISRLCALWFSNADFPSINESINSAVNTQPSAARKSIPLKMFLPLIYQLAARASYDRSESHPSHFQRTLVRLLVQLTIKFPFNCIYQLLALRAGDCTGETTSTAKKRKLLTDPDEADLRAAAASLVIDQSRKITSLTAQISAIEVLVEAYVELANAAPPGNLTKNSLNGVIDFHGGLKIKKLLYPLPVDSALRQVPIPTGPVDGESFAGFIDGYRLLGGINLPKCIDAVSCSGNRHSQLVKGRDDVRQDAVMEQVFLRVNKLLKADGETRRRGLNVRTYRVIPLQSLVGLIEWVSDSVPLATFLSEAHERLRPGDLTASKCRELIKAEAERPGSTTQSKLNVLVKEIGQRFRPVLRYFFFEHFSVETWWTAKHAYTRSMAAASIVGWIVGLGDRHGMNILLDRKTGEIVHIDLNMIFEAGRTLRVPERVPFRMTPDCVDGLGPEGIGLEGPFKNHAVATLKVLRRERALIMMILDVFKYDPLQKWTGLAKVIENNNTKISANESVILNTGTGSTGSSTSDVITKEADRALMRIKGKLEGREEGVILSEAGHVAFLIQTATDPELLCQMYVGWQAYF